MKIPSSVVPAFVKSMDEACAELSKVLQDDSIELNVKALNTLTGQFEIVPKSDLKIMKICFDMEGKQELDDSCFKILELHDSGIYLPSRRWKYPAFAEDDILRYFTPIKKILGW